MKFTATLITAAFASAAAFSPSQSTPRSVTTEVHQYAPTKWTPQGGANPSFDGPAATTAAPAAPVVEAAPISSSYTNLQESFESSSTSKSYAPTHWSPKGGATGSSLWGAAAMGTPAAAAAEEPVAAAPAAAALAAAVGVKKDYSGTHWSPQGGATGGSLWGAAAVGTPAAAAPVEADVPVAAAAPVTAASAGPKKNYSGTHWSPQGGATGGALWAGDSAPAVAAAAAAAPVAADPAPVAAAGPKKNYAPTKWSPQGGATGW